MTTRLSADARRLLDEPNFAHLATLLEDGAPKVDPVWVLREADNVLVTSDRQSMKVANTTRDARVALSIVAFADPYEQLLIRGEVIEVRADSSLSELDRFAQKYLGAPFPRRRWSERVVLVIQPDIGRHYRSQLRDPRISEHGAR